MDGECAFCGRADAVATRGVYCEDCQTEHRVCVACADETSPDAAQLGLELFAEAA